MDGVLKYLWSFINTSQIIALISLIDVPLPSNIQILFSFMSIANGDFKYLESLPNMFEKWINYEKLEEVPPATANFKDQGFETGSFFLNY